MLRAETLCFMCGKTASRMVLCLAMAVWPLIAPTQPWHVAGAHTRLVLRRTADSAWPAKAGEVMLWPQGIDPENLVVVVYGEDGVPVTSKIFWSAGGEPAKILFDTSMQQMRYLLYFGSGARASSSPWDPEAGLMIETRKLPKGSYDTANAILALWDKAEDVQGRSYVPRIFLGVNPHGPAINFIARFRGYLRCDIDGMYEFATASDDGSVLMVDSRQVVAWPGVHTARGGIAGKHSGSVYLEPGLHRIDYFWVAGSAAATAVGAWKPPDADKLAVIPQGAFEPVARFEVEDVEPSPGDKGEAVYVEWSTLHHSMLDELGLFTVEFRMPGARPEWECVFHTDDGTALVGPRVRHTYMRAAPREIRLEVREDGQRLRSIRQVCKVQPRWDQSEMWTEFNFLKQREELMARDHSSTPADDLAAGLALAGRVGDKGLLALMGDACMARAKDFGAKHWEAFLQLGLHYASPEERDYAAADKALRAALALAGDSEPAKSTAALSLARFLLDVVGNPIEADACIKRISRKRLPPADVRKWLMVRADIQLSLGLREAATRLLTALTEKPDPKAELKRELRRRARLEAARNYLRRDEYAGAIQVLDALEEEWALERISMEVGLLRARVFKGRGEYPRAVSLCRRLLTSAGGQNLEDARAELLYTLIETERAMGRTPQAERELERLLEEHPLSEAAARGKEAWGAPAKEEGQP